MQPLATKTGSSFTERFRSRIKKKKKVGGEEREGKKSRRVDFKHSRSSLLGKLL